MTNPARLEDDLRDRLQFAATLASARLRLTNQTELARELGRLLGEGVSQSAVSRWLTIEARPPLEGIVALARLAGVDPGWLAMGELSLAPAPETWVPLPAEPEAPPLASPVVYGERKTGKKAAAEVPPVQYEPARDPAPPTKKRKRPSR